MLVVDDEPPLRRLIRRGLEAEQFRVEEAGDGESALQLIQSRLVPFDLVLTDLSMPGIDGRQIQATLRRYRPTIAVLCMSAEPEELPPIDGAETSIAVLRKPFREDRFVPRYPGRAHSRFGSQGGGRERDRPGQFGIEPTGLTLQESRAARRESVDLVAVARRLRGTAHSSKAHEHLWRRPSRYTRAELQELRISRVHARDPYLFCLLSDRNMVRVPLTIAPGFSRAAGRCES